MARVIQTQIKTPLADEVLFGRLKNGGVVRVVVTADDSGAKKLGFVYPEGPAQPRLERDLIVAGRKRAVDEPEARKARARKRGEAPDGGSEAPEAAPGGEKAPDEASPSATEPS
jgi:ATP-dependent Clp protease ATP-binding subunit ClpA